MKEWKRNWKVRLIEEHNPYWEDLAVSLLGFEALPRSHPGESRAPRTSA